MNTIIDKIYQVQNIIDQYQPSNTHDNIIVKLSIYQDDLIKSLSNKESMQVVETLMTCSYPVFPLSSGKIKQEINNILNLEE